MSVEEEKSLSKCLVLCAQWGFPLQRSELKEMVHAFLESRKRRVKVFRNNVPGTDRVAGFLKLHEKLAERATQNIRRQQASVSEEIFGAYFDNLKE